MTNTSVSESPIQLNKMSNTRGRHYLDCEQMRAQIDNVRTYLENGDLEMFRHAYDSYKLIRGTVVESARLETGQEFLNLIAQYEVRRKAQ